MSTDVKHEARASHRDAARAPEPAQAQIPDVLGSPTPVAQTTGGEKVATSGPVTIDEVLGVDGVMRLLAIGRNTVYELVGRNEIPHRRLGKQIRFNRAAIMRWLDSWSSRGAKERQ